ncbi:DUF6145 family protein [Hespellia stercorisuis]|uniref:Uncharacterized protein n=1 Tax=Hespellia stercorisuis DSM 15480 TaxID=1121950 RepID=A0A1M6NF76_9FIRM|nr:DUF6145 family protein [Hespellia stercorisuis]SHJ94408.1 hypothetical protein SAMN02745243_01790 [Hespellia stercorisuis DSM 15480]
MEEKTILCASSAYEKKYYLNPEFNALPETVRQELQIMCVLYTEDVGGILMVVFDENGELKLEVSQQDGDLNFDEIGSALKIKEMQREKTELFEALQVYYRVVFLGEEM